jgi:hypothetical protein
MGWHISMLLHLVYIYLNMQFTHDETALSEKKCKRLWWKCKHKYYDLMGNCLCEVHNMMLFHLLQYTGGCEIGVVINYEKWVIVVAT